MEKSHEILKRAVTQCGAKSIASDMGLSQSLIYKWCQSAEGESDSGAENPLDRVLKIVRLTQDESPIDWLCRQTDSYRVKNQVADATLSISDTVVIGTQSILKEFSDVLEAVTQSYAHESRIDLRESERIRKEWEELKSITEQFVRACEAGAFDPQRSGKVKEE
jgi:hypothetical protein